MSCSMNVCWLRSVDFILKISVFDEREILSASAKRSIAGIPGFRISQVFKYLSIDAVCKNFPHSLLIIDRILL